MNVLVVDDDPDIRELVAFKLEQMGHSVKGEADGEAGLLLPLPICLISCSSMS